jgi:recombination associated protein RdgC
MWFKNLTIYQLNNRFNYTAESLSEKLAERRFSPLARQADKTLGWISPVNRHQESLAYEANGCLLFCMRKEQKIIPASAVKEALEEKVMSLQAELGRKIYRKEKQNIKDDIVSAMLPKAFSRASHISAYIDKKNQWLVVNASSATQVDEFYEFLVATIGTLGATLLNPENSPADTMRNWLMNSLPENWRLSGEYLMKDPVEERTARFKDNDAGNPFVQDLLEDGYLINRLGVLFNDQVKGVIFDDLRIGGVKFDHRLLKENDEISEEDDLSRFDADFVLMTSALSEFIVQLKQVFNVAKLNK